tara:strand:+ start:277 stop:468 length:192 start_codon:yes stop_codon:yes gene_type:complete
MYMLLVFIFFVGGGWLIGSLVSKLFLKSDKHKGNTNESPLIINQYTTENHLHITKEDLKSIKK